MSHPLVRSTALIVSLCSAIGLVACGGGGGGTSVTPPPMVTLNGVAAKGLIKNGVVQIYTTDSIGNISEQPIATTKTDGNGAYSLSIPAQTSAVLATVTPALDNTTKVANDLKPSEADSLLPADFKMSAVIGGAAAKTTLSINPYSDLAMKSAIQGGKLLSSYANITNQYVKTYLLNGIDPVATLPSVSTKSKNPNELAMTAALLGVSVAAENDTICKTYTTVGERYNCIITRVSTAISINSDTTVTITNSQVLTNLSTARTTLTGADYQTLTKDLGVATQVTAFANDEGLKAVIAGASKAQSSTTNSGSSTTTPPALTFEEYANDLKRALKTIDTNFGNYGYLYQYSGLNYFRQNGVNPTLDSVRNAFEFISNHCEFGGLAGTSTCATGLHTLSWGTVVISEVQPGTYTWTGTEAGGGYAIAGTLSLTTNIDSATFNMEGTIANTDPGLSTTEPIQINFGITVTQNENGKYTAKILNSTVKYPESTATLNGSPYTLPKFTANLSEVTLDSTLFSGGWSVNCITPINPGCVITTSEKFWAPESINGIITITDSWGDYAELKIGSKFRVPSQTQWTAMSGYNRYMFHKDPIASEFSLMGTLSYVGIPSWYWGYGTVQVSANLKADFSKVDRSQPYSQTNFPRGSFQIKEVLSTQSGSDGRTFTCAASDACIDALVERVDYDNAQASFSIYVGNFDKLTIVPDNTDNSFKLDNNAVENPNRLTMNWLNFKLDEPNFTTGFKIYSSNHAFVLTMTRDSNGHFREGVIQDKDKKTVGIVKGGLLYINGQIYSLI
jgi:hypothetical protein